MPAALRDVAPAGHVARTIRELQLDRIEWTLLRSLLVSECLGDDVGARHDQTTVDQTAGAAGSAVAGVNAYQPGRALRAPVTQRLRCHPFAGPVEVLTYSLLG